MSHKDILNNNTGNAAKGSNIQPIEPPKQISFDDVLNYIETYFNKAELDVKANFKNGKIPLIREQFDMSQFYKSINSIIESSYNECIETMIEDASDREKINILLRSIFKSIQSSNEILATMECTQKIPHLILIKLLSYCLYSFNHYHKSYDRRRQIQEQTNND